LLMAREAVDKHLEVAGALLDPKATLGAKLRALPGIAAFYAVWYPSRWLGWRGWFGYGAHGPLSTHLRFIDRQSRRLARAAFHGMLIHGPGLEHRQGFLFRWVDIAMELYAMTATISRALAMRAAGHPDAAEAQAVADRFCSGARNNVARHFRALWQNDDEAGRRLAADILEGRHRWLEAGIITLEEAEAADARRGATAREPARTSGN